MKKVLITDEVPAFFPHDLEKLGYEVSYQPGLPYEQVKEQLPEYEVMVIRSSLKVDRPMLEQAQRLKVILRPGSGLDNVDVLFAESRGVTILNSPEGNKNSVAEHAVGMLLGLLHHIPRSAQEVRQLQWRREENRGTEISGCKVGIIGYGNTGSAFGNKLLGFDLEVLVYDKFKAAIEGSHVKQVDIADIYREADIVSLHIPLNNETRHLVNDEFIRRFRKPFWLVNTSRGGVVNTADLLEGVKSGKVLGAALDVLENESLPEYSDEERQLLLDMIATERVLITPHIAGWSHQSKQKIFSILVEKLKIWLGVKTWR